MPTGEADGGEAARLLLPRRVPLQVGYRVFQCECFVKEMKQVSTEQFCIQISKWTASRLPGHCSIICIVMQIRLTGHLQHCVLCHLS